METIDIIRQLCKENGLSISGLEKKLGYGNTSLSKAKNISSKRIVEISNFFGVSPSYLLPLNDLIDDAKLVSKEINRQVNAGIAKAAENTHTASEHANEITENHNVPKYDAEQISTALMLYEKYQSASPQIREAIEVLLKSQ